MLCLNYCCFPGRVKVEETYLDPARIAAMKSELVQRAKLEALNAINDTIINIDRVTVTITKLKI